MRLTTRTNLAARILMSCAVNDGRTVRTSEIAGRCNASLNHLLQVVSLLQAHGFVATCRGRSGGIRLARPMERISIGEVFRIFEAGVPFAECFDGAANSCPLTATCRLRGAIARAVEAFYHELDQVTLADLVQGNCGLAELLAIPRALVPACPGP
jgi:Rrf2 family nitric oxide-sensitive transcriptional repressor